MSKLDDVLGPQSNLSRPAKKRIKDLMLEIIGEDDAGVVHGNTSTQYSGGEDITKFPRNELRALQRQKVMEL